MPTHALAERTDLVGSLRAAGPDAPTLCGEWTTSQLAAHLVLRERSFTEVLGRVPVARLQAVAQHGIDAYVAAHDFEQLVSTLERGTPRFSPFALPIVRENVNLLEYLIHDEDVRRAAPEWTPRVVPVDRQQAVWSKVRLVARFTLRSLPFAVALAWPSHGSVQVGRGTPRVTVTGDPIELALLVFGRQPVARVDYDGADDDITTVQTLEIKL